MLSRFALYFEEVARRGSIRRAAESLSITPSAIDRQILLMEERLGVPLFDRTSRGLRLTAAGEVLVDAVRRWKRDIAGVESHIDELRGLRRGAVSIAFVEGAAELLTRNLADFNKRYPGIIYHMHTMVSEAVVDTVLAGEADIGLAFNPPDRHDLRVESALVYQVGAVMRQDHPLAGQKEVTPAQCAEYPLVGPAHGNVLQAIIDQAWMNGIGEHPRFVATAGSISLMKSLVTRNIGLTFLTRLDVADEVKAGILRYVPLSRVKLPLSVLSLISASGRRHTPPAMLLMQHISTAMQEEDAPHIG